MDRERILEELEKKKKHSQILRKKILLILISSVIFFALIFGVFTLYIVGWFKSEDAGKSGGFLFDPHADENYDIMTDEAYIAILEAQPFINLKNAQTGITESLLPENYEKEGPAVKLLTDMIIAIQNGDSDTYNSIFSSAYLISEGKRKAAGSDTPEKYQNYTDEQYLELGRQRDFTMQQIYDVYITFVSETTDTSSDTKTYTYEVEYKIRKNNGTFRTDLGSDAPRPQTITIFENKKSDKIEIVSVITFSSVKNEVIVHGWRIAIVSVLSVLIIAADIFFAVKSMKKIQSLNDKKESLSDNLNDSDKEEEKHEETLGD